MPLSKAVLNAPVDLPENAKCPDGTTQSMEKIEAALTAERLWEKVKYAIAVRDEFRCRMCGKRCSYGSTYLIDRADPHHIIFSSQGGEDSTANCLVMCRQHHDEIHKLKRWYLSGNADERDELANGMVKVERQVEGGFEVVGFI